MTLYYLLAECGDIDVQNLIVPHKNTVFMNVLQQSDGHLRRNQYRMKDRLLDINVIRAEKKNYITDTSTGEQMKLMNVHFQGFLKSLMRRYQKLLAV